MRIIAMSDSHGDGFALEKVFKMSKDNGDIFVHLGDGERELEDMIYEYPELDIRHVAGNCDYNSAAADMIIIRTGTINVLATHGHIYGVNYGVQTLVSIAKNNGCRAVLFGHTHVPHESYEDGVYLLNPGSCASPRDGSKPSYGYIDITPQGIITNIVEL